MINVSSMMLTISIHAKDSFSNLMMLNTFTQPAFVSYVCVNCASVLFFVFFQNTGSSLETYSELIEGYERSAANEYRLILVIIKTDVTFSEVSGKNHHEI